MVRVGTENASRQGGRLGRFTSARRALSTWLDGFVPAALRRDDPAAAQRARLAVSVAWLVIVVVGLLALSRALAGNLREAALDCAVALVVALATLVLRATGWFAPLLNACLLSAYTSSVASCILVRGAGVTSATIGLAVLPLVATLLGGVRLGAAWVVASGLAGLALGWLGHRGLIVDRLPAGELLFNEHSALFIMTGGLFFVAVLYERQKEQTLRKVATLSEERGEAERKASRARTAAETARAERLVSMGRLAGGVAHEINNPLGYVLSNLELVAEQLRDQPGAAGSEEIKEMLSEARSGVERIRRIVRDLKSFSRADEERRVPVDLRKALEPAINITQNEIKHRARLVRAYSDIPLVECDEVRLGQVFVNLLVNAAQSIPEGRAEDNEIRVVTRTSSAGEAVVEVHDTGTGVAPENIDRIFDPFFTTKDVGAGTGLGLSICHGIVTALGGQLVAESEPGATVFRVTLPAARKQAAAPARATPPAAPETGRRGRILAVDDDPLGARVLVRVLGKDHDVTALCDARLALERVAGGERFDVILCDLMMPDMTGMELCEKLGEVAPEQAERMVFITGGAFTPDAKAFLDRVRNQRVEKPFGAAVLRALVRGMVERGGDAGRAH
jgi:signal transduction histidine kinase